MFFLLNKPSGVTSFQFINGFAKARGIAKIGHAGTLDPLATGLMLVATDDDTPLLAFADRATKLYEVEMQLGLISDTYDISGKAEPTNQVIPTFAVIKKAIENVAHHKTQLPPAYSAKRINGQRAHNLARQGQVVELAPISISVSSVSDITQVSHDTVRFNVQVSRGAYIRTIVHDLGEVLKCGAVMSALHRAQIGELLCKDAVCELDYAEACDLAVLDAAKLSVATLKTLADGNVASNVYLAAKHYLIMGKGLPLGVAEATPYGLKPIKILGKRLSFFLNESL